MLQAEAPAGSTVTEGTVLSWSGSLCTQMVAGEGPTVAPRVADVRAYARAANRQSMDIEAYAGVPLRLGDGTVFGSLCGFDPEPQSDALLAAKPAIQLAGRLLATVLDLELGREQLTRRAERAELDATRDELTGLANRRGWNQVVAAEEARCLRYGHPACVLVLDINGLKAVNDDRGHAAGDELLRTCAQVLSRTTRDADLVARLGGDEFAVLTVETDGAGGRKTAAHLREALAAAGIPAAIGVATRPADGSLDDAWRLADAAMYRDKATGSSSCHTTEADRRQ
ncbi:GGDEF domain-containing protein [Angustibacter luteus]|uniref:GGDEF domain-containing protein n=1 Tax=Angustibacter luteus TaxID=658456 RepID=A0ABW1JDW5_9ACTN